MHVNEHVARLFREQRFYQFTLDTWRPHETAADVPVGAVVPQVARPAPRIDQRHHDNVEARIKTRRTAQHLGHAHARLDAGRFVAMHTREYAQAPLGAGDAAARHHDGLPGAVVLDAPQFADREAARRQTRVQRRHIAHRLMPVEMDQPRIGFAQSVIRTNEHEHHRNGGQSGDMPVAARAVGRAARWMIVSHRSGIALIRLGHGSPPLRFDCR